MLPIATKVLLLLLLIGSTRSAATDFAKLAGIERAKFRLDSLLPESILGHFFDNGDFRNLSADCAKELSIYGDSLRSLRPWALRMKDASSRVPPGWIVGNILELGNYDDCVVETKEDEVRGRHCIYSIKSTRPQPFHIPLDPTMSICVPATCDTRDVENLISGVVRSNGSMASRWKISYVFCTRTDERKPETGFYVSLFVIGAWIGFVTLCTLCDLMSRRRSSGDKADKDSSGLSRLSLLRATEKLWTFARSQDDDLPVVHGVRVISFFSVAVTHAYLLGGIHQFNLQSFTTWFGTWYGVLAALGTYNVDTFFVMSGFLMTRSFFKKMQKNGTFNVLEYYAHRYLRLTMPIVVLLVSMFFIMWYPLTTGAVYDWMESILINPCRTKWWAALTYTINFVEPDNRCLEHLWFMSVDMQLFLISPLILFPLYKKPKLGLTILVTLVLTSIALNVKILVDNQYSAMYFNPRRFTAERFLKAFNEVYVMPHTRAIPWLMGILLGYKLFNEKEKPTKHLVIIGWIFTILAFAFCISGFKILMDSAYEYNIVQEAIFAALSRPLWSCAACWILYASFHGYGGPINAFFSWQGFIPLSKLSYCSYLLHLLFPMIRLGGARTVYSDHLSNYVILHSVVSDIGLAIALSFSMSVVFEMPMLAFDSLIFQKKELRKKID